MNFRRAFVGIMLILIAGSYLSGQVGRQTGMIRGIITDQEDVPIPGVAVTATSPSLLGTISDVTSADGAFRCPSLPPGTYTLVAELQNYRTVRQENIIVRVGMIVTINPKMDVSVQEEEITVVASSPTIDVQSSKVSQIVTAEAMRKLPLGRNLFRVLTTNAGVTGNIDAYSGTIYGAESRSTKGTVINWEVDGVHVNESAWGGPIGTPNFDAIEEIEISVGGLPANIGNTGGGFLNVVTKSGGNDFHGSAQTYYSGERLVETLLRDEELSAMSIGKPSAPIYAWDNSGTLGGPISRDKAWFFLTLGHLANKNYGRFVPTTIFAQQYEPYDYPERYLKGSAKISAQVSNSLRFFILFNGELENIDVYPQSLTRATYAATYTQKNNHRVMATGNLTWLMGSNTYTDFRLGYIRRDYPISERGEYAGNIALRDAYTGYQWNGVNTWASQILHEGVQASAKTTHFMDKVLGGDHEVSAGIEYDWGQEYYGYYRTNPLTLYYYNGNPYYYRGYYGLVGPHPTFGDGRVQFTNCGHNPGDSEKALSLTHLGGYIQDSFRIKNRLVINAGLRLDYYVGQVGKARTTGTTGLTFDIGKSLEPALGFNPFGPFEMEPIRDIVSFAKLSPRIGLSYDLFGNGKTSLKFAYSRYNEQMTLNQFYAVSPAVLQNLFFNWSDLNENGELDPPGVDKYVPRDGLGQFTQPNRDYLIDSIDPNTVSPHYDELLTSITHELFPNWAVRFQHLYKRASNLPGYHLYDRVTERYWYNYEDAPEWWVPFTTIVPAQGIYPEQEVTAYFRTYDSPWDRQFIVQGNSPESKVNYHAFELAFDKRYSNGWSLGGSVLLPQTRALRPIAPWAPRANSPNDFVNAYGLEDGSLYIKLFGSVELPFGFVSSFLYRHNSGSRYQRTVTVTPPAGWAATHNTLMWSETVMVEEKGSRLSRGFDQIDVRFEKEFNVLSGRLGLFVDIDNVLGNIYINVGQNPGGTWRPIAENTSVGTYTPDYSYRRVGSIQATRIFRLSLRYSF